MVDATAHGPLAGLHVLEIAHYIAGPHCAMVLGDRGAEVVKLEPVGGEPGRKAPPFHPSGDSLYFACHNRGKRSIGVDLGRPEAADVLAALLRWADIVVTNFSPGVPERLGFGYEQLARINPRAVLVQISAFGSWSARADHVAFDGVIQAMSGFAHMTGQADGPPTLSQVLVADHATAAHGAFAALCAVRERERTGRGAHVEISMLDALTSTLAHFLPAHAVLGVEPARAGNRSATRFVNVFDAADAPVYVAPITPAMWRAFCTILDNEEWAVTDDTGTPKYVENQELRRAVEEAAQTWFATRPAAEAVDVLQERGIPAGVVRSISQLWQEESAARSPTVRYATLPATGDRVPVPGAAFRFPGEGDGDGTVPSLGAHTDVVLRKLGFGDHEIERLRRDHVLACPAPDHRQNGA